MDDFNRPKAKCPSCFSEERHRALQLFLDAWLPTLAGQGRILHQAPDNALRPSLEQIPRFFYIAGDLAELPVTVRYDLHHTPFRSESFKLVIASHVLEHVADDRAVMAELLRILEPGGTAVILVPIDNSRAQTYEDPTVTTAAQRADAYWQFDHMRLYGRDFGDRLARAGFSVRIEQPSRLLTSRLVRRHGLGVDPSVYAQYPIASPDEIFVATRP